MNIFINSGESLGGITSDGLNPKARLENLISAFRETCVSRHNGGPIKGPSSYTPQYDCDFLFGGVSEGGAGCRETSIPRAAVRLIAVVFPVWIYWKTIFLRGKPLIRIFVKFYKFRNFLLHFEIGKKSVNLQVFQWLV